MKLIKIFITTTLFTLQSTTQAVAIFGAGASVSPIHKNLLMLSQVDTNAANAGTYLLQQVDHNEDTFNEIRKNRILGTSDPFVDMEKTLANAGCVGDRKSSSPADDQIDQVTKMEISMSRYGNACRDTLYSVDLNEGAKEKINVNQYCDCVTNVTDTVTEEQSFIPNSDQAYKNKLYSAIVASRVYNLLDLIRDNAGRLERYRHKLSIRDENFDRFTCTKSDIDKISQKIESCFSPQVRDAIDKKIGYNLDNLLKTNAEGDAKQRLNQLFTNSNSDIDEYFDERIAAENVTLDARGGSKRRQFIDLFIVKFNEQRIGGEGYSKDYKDDLKAYIYNNKIFSREFYSFREKEIAKTDKLSRSLYYQTNGKEGRLDYADQIFTAEEEEQFLIQYVSFFSSKFMKSMVRDADDFEQVSKALKDIKSDDTDTKRFIFDSLMNHLTGLKEEVISECESRIEELEYTCDPTKVDDVMKSVSAVEFTEANELFGGNDIATANFYCSAVDKGEISQTVAGGYGNFTSTYDPALVFDEVRGSHGQQIASLRESYEKGGLANAFNNNSKASSTIDNISNDAIDDGAFSQTAEYLNKKYNANSQNRAMANDSQIAQVSQAQVVNNQTSVASNNVTTKHEAVERDLQSEVDKIEEKLSSTETGDTEAQELRKQLRELKEQLASVAKNALAVNEESSKNRERVAASEQAFNEDASYNGVHNSGYTGAVNSHSQVRAVATAGAGGSRGSGSASIGASSSAGMAAVASSLGPAEMASGLSLSSSTGSDILSVSDNRIGKQDRKRVADAISEGSNRVVLADGQTYFIGHDDNGNVILSQSKDALYEVAILPELEGPQLEFDQIKKLDNAGRSIASEPSEVSSEESIYSKFLNAAEISE
ncbi:hypothetical protein ACRXCV_11340 [Halobacteriovorax sp. GFR7]|uniref:hypothetical protein n=1 Tax=unclassified Halobacteriovorax TaxID=2639665 RepID=UPI003D976EFF